MTTLNSIQDKAIKELRELKTISGLIAEQAMYAKDMQSLEDFLKTQIATAYEQGKKDIKLNNL